MLTAWWLSMGLSVHSQLIVSETMIAYLKYSEYFFKLYVDKMQCFVYSKAIFICEEW